MRLVAIVLAAAAAVAVLLGCTDAATRIAYDVEEGARSLASSQEARATVRHEPSRWPDGCAAGYTVEIGQGRSGDPRKGSIHVRCAGRGHYYTTYHLNFVFVPATVTAAKRPGEAVMLELERRGGEIAIAGVR